MAVRANRIASGLLFAMAAVCTVAAFAILFFAGGTSAAAIEFASVGGTSGFDPLFWLFFASLCGATFSALAALATWQPRQ
jgi:hypothetical protein